MISLAFPGIEAKKLNFEPRFTIDDLVEGIGNAVENNDIEGVRRVLEGAITEQPGFLPDKFLRAKPGTYARREVYSDPGGRFSILAMVWAPGQGTLLHDHAGLWVVEAVYRGQVQVQNYEHLGVSDGLHRFVKREERLDSPGISDRRIPPDEHHLLLNVSSENAVTIHVFGGILDRCNVFEPGPGGYRKISKTMCLD